MIVIFLEEYCISGFIFLTSYPGGMVSLIFFFFRTLHVCIHLMSHAIFMLVYSFVFASFDPA